jgi:hypothetical protein
MILQAKPISISRAALNASERRPPSAFLRQFATISIHSLGFLEITVNEGTIPNNTSLKRK